MSRYVVQATWDDVAHLSEDDKRDMLASLPPHQREARTKGIPSLGSGAIYPILEDEITIKPFKLPAYWPRAYGLDVGWKKTAAIWGAWDRESDIIYVYSEHYRGQAEPSVHAAAIKARGKWIKGAIDTAARGRSQADGKKLFDLYEDEGLKLENAKKAVEAGLLEVYQRLSTGRLKIFTSLNYLLSEYRIYRRDEKGQIVKENDHALDALRYLVMTINEVASLPPVKNNNNISTSAADTYVGY